MKEYNEEKLIYETIAVHTSEVFPDSTDLWPQIASHLPQKRHPFRSRLVPATRLGWIAFILFSLLALGAAAYGGATVSEKLFTDISGRHMLGFKADVIQEIGQSQTINGITVTVKNAYVLDNQLGIEWMVSDMPLSYVGEDSLTHYFGPDGIGILTTETGEVLMPSGGISLQEGYYSDYGIELPPGSEISMSTIEIATVNDQSELRATFSISIIENISYVDPSITDPPFDSNKYITVSRETVAGPFTFDLTIPLEGN